MCKWYGMTFGMFVTLSDDCDFSLVQAKQLLGQPKKKKLTKRRKVIGKSTFPVKITDVKSDASMSNQLHHIDMFTLLHDMNYAQIILDS